MAQGTIKKLMEKGFGFIESGDGEVFFHLSAVDGVSFDQLSEGQMVEFESEPGEKGPRATTVRPA